MERKRYRIVTFVFIFCFLLKLFSVDVSASATEILTPESLLVNFEEKEEIEALAVDIVDIANCFESDGFHAEISDIDFLNAYCVYIEAGILEALPNTMEEVENLLDSAHRVWCIPVYSEENVVIVQVSKSLSNQEWHPVCSTMYEIGEVAGLNIGQILSLNNKDADNCQCVFVEGESGVRTPIALVLKKDSVSGAIVLEDGILNTASEQGLKTEGVNGQTAKVSIGDVAKEDTLQRNQIYLLDDLAKVAAQNLEESSISDDTRSLSSGNAEPGIAVGFYIIGGVVLGILIFGSMFLKRHLKNKRV